MLKSLYTTATGMKAQQTMVDMIANNIANVNTSGFKKSQASFEDLFYVTLQSPGLARGTNGDAVPIGTQIGSGTRLNGTTKVFTTGTLEITERSLDVAIDGDGFFSVILPDGAIRVGDPMPAFTAVDDGGVLFDSERLRGNPVLIKFFRAHW